MRHRRIRLWPAAKGGDRIALASTANNLSVQMESGMSVSRRDLLKTAALSPALAGAMTFFPDVSRAADTHSMQLRPRAVLVDGKPLYLVSGSMDYMRMTASDWRPQLLRAKRGGLNMIAFYVAWNFHEREDGVISFAGDADLGHFLDICGELGLYAFPRCGPFIADEWENGGYPAWLLTKPDIALRTNHPPTMAYVRRWFQRLIGEVIAPRQVTRGGPVMFAQQENEMYYVGRAGLKDYQSSLIGLMREFGLEIPITDCNGDSGATRLADSMMTQNSGGAANIARIRRVQPDKPAIITELYTDYLTVWGWPLGSYPTTRQVQQTTFETLAVGGMYNFFVYNVGTTFGFWSSSTWKTDEAFCSSRYYARAPVAEGGAFNPTYYATKAVNVLALNASRWLTAAEQAKPPVQITGPVRTDAVKCSRGWLLFVQPQYKEILESYFHVDGTAGPLLQTGEEWPLPELAQAAGAMQLPGGSVSLAESSEYGSMLPWQLEIDPGRIVDYANCTFFGLAGTMKNRVLLLRGEAGRPGVVSINGQRKDFAFSAAAPTHFALAGITVLGLSHEWADRTWFADGRVFLGPAYVGEQRDGQHECFLDLLITTFHVIAGDGSISTRNVPTGVQTPAQVPLTDWTSREFPEISATSAGWQALEKPVGMEYMGLYYGYGWYRARIPSASARRTGLWFTDAIDRVRVFSNGKNHGVWGRGAGATRDPLPIDLQAGDNDLVFLIDNMGRSSEGGELNRKGILGPAFVDVEVLPLAEPVYSRPSTPPGNSWQFQTFRVFSRGFTLSSTDAAKALADDAANLHAASYTLTVPAGAGLTLSLLAFTAYAWVLIDGKVVGEHAGDLSLAGGVSYVKHRLDPYLTGKTLQLQIVYYGKAMTDFNAHVRLHSYRSENALTDWAFRPWATPKGDRAAAPGDPTWWETRLPKPSGPGPYFLVTEGLSKGHLYVNGRDLGRYWEIGPQHSQYVPEGWLQADNVIAIFDEEGRSPASVYLVRDARVPTQSIWL